MISGFTIRPEAPNDYRAISEVVEAAFGSPVEARLVDAIRASELYVPELALVAEHEDEILGHVMISGATLRMEHGDRAIAMLSPLAVAPQHQRGGVGSALVNAVTRRADARDEPLVILEGNPAYYGRLGFEPAAPLGIEIPIPDWAPPEAGQVLRLRTYDPTLRGRVIYPPAFDSVSAH
jgi:putative acetyltransferase